MGVLSDLMGGGAGKGGGAGIISKVGSALKRKKKKSDSDSDAGSNYAGDTGIPEYKRGGKVKRTGIAKVHKNEEVLTAKEAKRYRSRGKKR